MSVIEDILKADVFVTSVNFSEQSIEISFLENREQGEEVAMLRNMMVSLAKSEDLQQAFRDLQEMLRDVIDEGYFMLHNPQDGMSIRERMLARRQQRAEAAEAEAVEDSGEPSPPPQIGKLI
jgi:hypothetical protein